MRRRLRKVAATALLCAFIVGCGGPEPSPSGAAALRRDPNALSYNLYDPRPPARLPGTTHAIDLRIDERFITIAEGIVAHVWSIGSTVPGPVIRVQAGDTVRIHLINHPPELTGGARIGHPPVNENPHALEFDGATGAGGNQTATLKPAEQTVFEFTPDTPGVWLYHGSAQSSLQNIAYGMYGMLIVEPKGGLSPVDQELFFVQGEWYVGDYHPAFPPPPSLAKAQAADPVPDFVVLNGVADQYRDHPIPVGVGTRIRAFILDAGPNLRASFRIDGAVFDRVIKTGDATGGNENGRSAETVDLSPGQGAIVEFSLPRDGFYPILTRAGSAAGSAPLGLLETVPSVGLASASATTSTPRAP